MQPVVIIGVGRLREKFFRDAADEYKKRLSGMASVTETQLKEEKLKNDPSPAEIEKALDAEAVKIMEKIPKKAFVVPMCIEGKQFSSEALAAKLDGAMLSGKSSICFIIGSSHGLSDRVKNAANAKLSMSKLTFPHQLARVMLFEAVYRAGEINRGSKYHK